MGRGSGEVVPGCFVSADWRIAVLFCQCQDGNGDNSAAVVVFSGCVEVVCTEDVSSDFYIAGKRRTASGKAKNKRTVASVGEPASTTTRLDAWKGPRVPASCWELSFTAALETGISTLICILFAPVWSCDEPDLGEISSVARQRPHDATPAPFKVGIWSQA